MKLRLFLLTSVLLLAACGPDQTEESLGEELDDTSLSTTKTEEMETDTESLTESDTGKTPDPASGSHLLADFIHEQTFMDPYALQAWEDYQAVAADASYGEITLVQTENPNLSQLDGSSLSDIEERFEGLPLREDVYMEQVDISESEALHFYRYPAEAESAYSELSDFLVELSYYFIEDHLVFSSITPGFYQVDLNNLPDAQTLMTFTTVPEIASINPQVFTIAEMKVKDQLIHQTMIPATFVNEEGSEEIMAFYFFSHGEDILQYAFLPFEMVSQSFPDNSVLLYQQIIPEISHMDLDEKL